MVMPGMSFAMDCYNFKLLSCCTWQATSEKDVEYHLQWLYSLSTDDDNDRWLLIMCDTASAPTRDDGRITILDHVRMLVSKHHHECKEKIQASGAAVGRHIVLLYQVMRCWYSSCWCPARFMA